MNSGPSTLDSVKNFAEVTNISPFGIWVLSNDDECFISYSDFPFFENASVREIANVQTDAMGNFHWPDLDVDIELDSIKNIENYPFVYG